MDDFPGNANRERSPDKRPTPPKAKGEDPRPKVQKVVKTEAVKRKKGFGQRFKEVFFGGELKGASRYITTDVLLPAFRDLIVDATSKGVERLIYGESRRRRMGNEFGRPRVSYNNPLDRYPRGIGRSGPMLPDQPPLPSRRPRTSEEILLTSREDAELVIERLTDIIDKYEVASVADLYDLVGLQTSYIDNNWGWTSLAYADIRQIREGYLIDMPAAEPIR